MYICNNNNTEMPSMHVLLYSCTVCTRMIRACASMWNIGWTEKELYFGLLEGLSSLSTAFLRLLVRPTILHLLRAWDANSDSVTDNDLVEAFRRG